MAVTTKCKRLRSTSECVISCATTSSCGVEEVGRRSSNSQKHVQVLFPLNQRLPDVGIYVWIKLDRCRVLVTYIYNHSVYYTYMNVTRACPSFGELQRRGRIIIENETELEKICWHFPPNYPVINRDCSILDKTTGIGYKNNKSIIHFRCLINLYFQISSKYYLD